LQRVLLVIPEPFMTREVFKVERRPDGRVNFKIGDDSFE